MARQIDPWFGIPQTVVLEENLLAVQLRLQGLDVKLSEVEARLGRVGLVAGEAKSGVDEVSGQAMQLEAQLAGVAAALLMLADQLSTAGPARSAPAGGPAPADVSATVARKVTEILAEIPA
jgi:hypothetical protein